MDNLTFDHHGLSPTIPSIRFGNGGQEGLPHDIHPVLHEHHHSEPHLLSPGALHRYQHRLKQRHASPSRCRSRSCLTYSTGASPTNSSSRKGTHFHHIARCDDAGGSVRNGLYNGMTMSYPDLPRAAGFVGDGVDSTNTTNSPSLSPR